MKHGKEHNNWIGLRGVVRSVGGWPAFCQWLRLQARSSPGRHQLVLPAPPALRPAPVGIHKKVQGRCGAAAPWLIATLAAMLGGWQCT